MNSWWRLLWPPNWFRPARELSLGERGEDAAAAWLQRQGYRIVARRERNRWGELDIIAVRDGRIVFVEVKTRADAVRGEPVEAVTRTQQLRIMRAALGFLKRRRLLGRPIRFDVIGIEWPPGTAAPRIRHAPNAYAPPNDSFFS